MWRSLFGKTWLGTGAVIASANIATYKPTIMLWTDDPFVMKVLIDSARMSIFSSMLVCKSVVMGCPPVFLSHMAIRAGKYAMTRDDKYLQPLFSFGASFHGNELRQYTLLGKYDMT